MPVLRANRLHGSLRMHSPIAGTTHRIEVPNVVKRGQRSFVTPSRCVECNECVSLLEGLISGHESLVSPLTGTMLSEVGADLVRLNISLLKIMVNNLLHWTKILLVFDEARDDEPCRTVVSSISRRTLCLAVQGNTFLGRISSLPLHNVCLSVCLIASRAFFST
jgi:hypothetical protein